MNARIGCPARSLAWDLGGAARCPELRGTTSWPTISRVSEGKIEVKVIRHKEKSFAQAGADSPAPLDFRGPPHYIPSLPLSSIRSCVWNTIPGHRPERLKRAEGIAAPRRIHSCNA